MISFSQKINSFAGRWWFLDLLAIFCSRILPFFIFAGLVLLCFFENNTKIFLYCILSALFSRYAINEFIYLFYKKARPAGLEITKVLIPIPKNPSFPSGHASFFFGLSFPLFFFNPSAGIFFSLLSFFVGISRVFCGAHWLGDILAGAFAGALSSLLVIFLIK